ncbi:MAG: HD domain-containing protein [Actinobacteria bacterium]|uniref:Unannotated protein n=1 Tax=freshwater metagenome TaxID=449393 RepID=A0A6J6A5S9_9ZZZZ|nr:HD domain-containing protein [Actinomycetota bacterium]MSW78435.1 HD domain-containing protein [Actinomycetota bacterium]MSX55407.1 HD domain-containing protein [Actinomycetota bacterium]MSX94298.1 HD domain-containing protein [Actinomycetota bacterium]MSZ84029.1 HD domain-containing protein [Actinomycetota bacterium]
MTSLVHLARRFATSLTGREPAAAERDWAHAQLLVEEAALWDRMVVQDRRHSLLVARRFEQLAVNPSREALAAALLHDIGKTAAGMGTWARVLATVVGPRTSRFRQYHDHERIGAELLRSAGSHPATVELVLGRGPLAATLRSADNV